MSSALKTLDLLSHFTASQPQIGLSEFCRLSGRDKATTYRYLQTLEQSGFIEQDAETRKYRLGPLVLQLAQTREQTVPRKAAARAALEALAEATGETAHTTVLAGDTVYALDACVSQVHSTRVIIDIARFPLHATASGLCALAFGPDHLWQVACADLRRFTDRTPTTEDALKQAVERTRHSGFGQAPGSYQSDTHSLAAPVFEPGGRFAGAVSVASVATRCTARSMDRVQSQLIAASQQITHAWGGTLPPALEHIWRSAPSLQPAQDIAS